MATLKLNGNTSGYVSLTTNAVAQNNTLTMPDVTDTVATITAPTFLNSVALATTTGTSPGLGLFSPSANVLAFSTSVSERMRIDSSGNVGVATATPTAPLTVQSSAVIAAGSPAILVQGQSNSERIQIRSAGGDPVFAALTARGTQAAPTATQSGDNLGYYQVGGYDGTAYQRNAWMSGIATETWTTGNRGGGLVFSTTPNGSTTIAERMRIDSTGNVGIGSTTPQQTLDVRGNVNVLNTVIMGSSFLRNRIINGGMSVDQRNNGASQTITAGAALAYTADRFYAYCTGANVTGQRIANTINNPASNPSQYVYQFTGAASVTAIGFGTRIEAVNCWDLAGTTATLSVNLANGLLTTVTWTASYANSADSFGTLASPTVTQIATGTFTVTAALSRYSVSIPIPTAATTGIQIVFTVGAQTSATWQINNVQLEPGPVATPFERRLLGQELALCQRYYFAYAPANTDFQEPVVRTGLTSGDFNVAVPVTMRTTPVLVLGSSPYGRLVGYDTAFAPTTPLVTALSVGPLSSTSFVHMQYTNNSMTAAASAVSCSFDTLGSAAGIGLSAEL